MVICITNDENSVIGVSPTALFIYDATSVELKIDRVGLDGSGYRSERHCSSKRDSIVSGNCAEAIVHYHRFASPRLTRMIYTCVRILRLSAQTYLRSVLQCTIDGSAVATVGLSVTVDDLLFG